MQRGFDRRVTEATILTLVASGLLLGASLAGIGSSVALVSVLAVLAAALAAGVEFLPGPDTLQGVDLDRYRRDIWIAPAVAAVGATVVLGATPAELQAIGGLIGLAGMGNYFLRPIYHIGLSLAVSAYRAMA